MKQSHLFAIVIVIAAISVIAFTRPVEPYPPSLNPQIQPPAPASGTTTPAPAATSSSKSLKLETSIGLGATAFGVKIIPLELLEDSRCPINVVCIQAGTVRVRARVESVLGTSTMIFKLDDPVNTESEIMTLVEVQPLKIAGQESPMRNYRFFFTVAKR